MIVGLAPNVSSADEVGMAYIVTRNSRFYVVAHDGIDALTGRERKADGSGGRGCWRFGCHGFRIWRPTK